MKIYFSTLNNRVFLSNIYLFSFYVEPSSVGANKRAFRGAKRMKFFSFCFVLFFTLNRSKSRKKERLSACIIITVEAADFFFFISSSSFWYFSGKFLGKLFFILFLFFFFAYTSTSLRDIRVAGSTNLMSRYVWHTKSSQNQTKSRKTEEQNSKSSNFPSFITTQAFYSFFLYIFLFLVEIFHNTQFIVILSRFACFVL